MPPSGIIPFRWWITCRRRPLFPWPWRLCCTTLANLNWLRKCQLSSPGKATSNGEPAERRRLPNACGWPMRRRIGSSGSSPINPLCLQPPSRNRIVGAPCWCIPERKNYWLCIGPRRWQTVENTLMPWSTANGCCVKARENGWTPRRYSEGVICWRWVFPKAPSSGGFWRRCARPNGMARSIPAPKRWPWPCGCTRKWPRQTA